MEIINSCHKAALRCAQKLGDILSAPAKLASWTQPSATNLEFPEGGGQTPLGPWKPSANTLCSVQHISRRACSHLSGAETEALVGRG